MVERYQKISRIGRGTFGEAWLVSSTCSGRKYVVKEVRVEDLSKSELQKANTEALILARCKHNNIVRYKEVFMVSHPSTLCLVMEYADGGDLSCRVRAAKEAGELLQESVILKWFVQVIFAVQYLHSNDILHRDLKTQNIFLTKSDLVKVGDFGIARVLTSREDLATTAIGTPYYISPEICRRTPYNHKSDMWAIGCVLYELCSLSHPFIADTFPELVVRILRGAYRPLAQQYSNFVRDLIAVMLRTDPTRRPTADQVLMVPMLRPYVTAYLRQHEELITTSVGTTAQPAPDTPKATKPATAVVEDNAFPEQTPASRASNLREAILKRLPFPRPRSSSDSSVQSSSRRIGFDFPQGSGCSSSSSAEVNKCNSDSGTFSDPQAEKVDLPPVIIEPKQDRIIETVKADGNEESNGPLCSSECTDLNGISRISNASSNLYSSGSSTKEMTKGQTSVSSCTSCCSKNSCESANDKKSPVIHVKLYSTNPLGDVSNSARRQSHVLCHKVPLTSLSCCAECRTEEHGDAAPCACLCSSGSLGYSMESDSSSDKKSTCSSIISNVGCRCAEEVSCTCTKGSQITCEVDLVFEGENVKNVPMKNEIMEVSNSHNIGLAIDPAT